MPPRKRRHKPTDEPESGSSDSEVRGCHTAAAGGGWSPSSGGRLLLLGPPNMPPIHCRSSVQGHEEGGGRLKRVRGSGPGANPLVSTFFAAPVPAAAAAGRTLADLELDAVEGEEGGGLRDLLASLPEKAAVAKAAARAEHAARLPRWWAQLRSGHSLLLYGWGSKHDLLQRFAREQARDGACFTVNGLYPGLNAKQARPAATAAAAAAAAAAACAFCAAECRAARPAAAKGRRSACRNVENPRFRAPTSSAPHPPILITPGADVGGGGAQGHQASRLPRPQPRRSAGLAGRR